MPSRMERYYDSSDKTVTRTKRNRSLYDEIYEEKEYTNVEGIVKTPATENIDIEKIREMMRKYEDGEKVRTKRIDKTPKIEEIMEEDTPKNYDINDVLNKAMAEKKDDENTELVNKEENTTSDYWYYIKFPLIDVDLNKLKEKNSDTAGWINVNNTNINYPYVQGKDNNYYLDHSFDKKYNEAGWVFLDYRNDKNLSLVELREKKKDMLDEVYRILSICLGIPPQSFDFEYRDKDDRFFKMNNITPVEFFEKYVKINLDDYVSVINAPTDDKPFGRCFTVKFLGNVVDGSPVNYLNLPIGDLKMLAIKQMKDNVPVWFGSDVGQFSTRVEGILSKNILDVDKLFSTNFTMTKADRLNYGESLMTHAMLLTGVDLDDDQPTRYRIENSWGKDVGKDGFYVMTDEWFSEFVYQVVINKKYLSNEHLKMLDEEVIKLEPWDPMGSLARVK